MSTKMAEVVLTANGSAVKRILTDLQGALDGVKNHVDQLKISIKNNNEARKQMVAQGKKSSQEYKDLISESKQLNKELQAEEKHMKALNSAMTHNVQETKSLDAVIKNLANTSTRQLKQSLAQANRELLDMNSKSPGLKKMQQNIAAIKGQIDKNTGSMRKHNTVWQSAVRNITAYVGVFGMFNFVRGKMQQVMDANLQMSDQLSQIRMVSGLAMKDVRKLSDELNKMDTRTTLSELQQISYEGSKLGMGKYGVSGLTSFTESANKLNVALKEQMGDDTLTYVSKMVETMGMLKKMDIGEAMEKVGSTMFMLSSSSTSTSANIMEFAKRLTAMSKIAGITTPQLLALGSASDSMFLDPEVSATAFIKILQAIPKNAKAIEKQLHLTTGSIKQMVEQGNMMGALTTIFEKMHGQSTSQLAPMFKLLGSEGARMTYVMSAMSQNVDMLEKHVSIANDSFAKGVAIQQEYNLRQETAQGYLERANNIWKDAFTNTEGVDTVKSLTVEWYNLSKALQDSGVFFSEMKITMWLIIHALEALLLIAPAVIQFFVAKYIAQGVMAMMQSLSATWSLVTAKTAETVAEGANTAATESNTIAEGANAVATRGAESAQRGLNAAQKANVIGAIVTLVLTLIGAYIALRQRTATLSAEQRTLNDSMNKYKENVHVATYEAGQYFSAISKAAEGTKEKDAAIRNANKALAPYLKGISLEHKNIKELADIYQLVCTRIRQKLALQAKEDDLNKIVKPRLQWEAQKGVAYDAQNAKGGKHTAQNSDWVYGVISDAYEKRMTLKDALQNVRSKGGFDVTDKQFQSAYANRSAPYYGYVKGSYTGGKTVFKGITKGYGHQMDTNFDEQQLMWRAAQLAAQMYSTRDKQTGINKQWNKIIGNYTEDDTTENFTVVDKPTAEELAEARKEHNEKIKALREELRQGKEDSEALIGNIESWYKMQETAVENAVADGKIMRQDADALIRDMEKKKNMLLGNARYAIAGEKNQFESLRREMDNGITTNNGPQASNTLKAIKSVNVSVLHDKMSKFDGKGTEGINAGSFLNDIKDKGADNLRSAAKSDAKMTENLQKFAEYFGVVAKSGDVLAGKLESIGLSLTPIEETAGKILNEEKTTPVRNDNTGFATSGSLAGNHDLSEIVVSAKRGKPTNPMQDMLNEWMNSGSDKYKYDPTTNDGIELWFKGFVEDGNGRIKDWAKRLPEVLNWDDLMNGQGSGMDYEQSRKEFTDNAVNHIKLLYLALSYTEDQQYEELRKKSETHKKHLDTEWKATGMATAYDNIRRDTQQRQNFNKASGITTLGSAGEMGLTSVSRYTTNNDSVQNSAVTLSETREQLEDAKMQFGDDALAIKEYSDKMIDAEYAYINAMSQAMSSQIDALLKFIEPMKTAAEQMGEMLGTLVTQGQWNADSFNEIMGNMVKSYADMCIQMVSDEVTRQTRMELLRKQEKDDTEQHQGETTSITKAGEEAKTGVEEVASKKIMDILTNGSTKKKKDKKKTADETKKIDKESADSQLKVETVLQGGIANIGQDIGQQITTQHLEQAQTNAGVEKKETTGSIFSGIAKGAAKIIGTLGPWGIPLIAVITSLLMGLLNSAISALFGGGSDSSSKSTVNTKLKTGMLTYDRGNVSSFGGIVRALDGGEVIGTDGNVYHSAASMSSLSTGLITQPTVTMVNGLPSIVGEKGPEMVIGRETTRAMSLNAPGLMRTIVNFDRNYSGRYRPLANGDMGGLDTLIGTSSASYNGMQQTGNGSIDSDTARQLTSAITQLVGQLQQPIRAEINKYGKGGLVDEVKSGLAFDAKYGGLI